MELMTRCKQIEFGVLVGISQQAVSDLITRRVLSEDGTAGQWLREYCGHLREQAAGRNADGGMNLATERARLSRAQAEIAEMNLAERRGSLVPIAELEPRLKSAIIAAREYMLGQPPRLAVLLDGLDRHGREDLLTETFNEFLHLLASMNGAAVDPLHTSALPDPEDDE